MKRRAYLATVATPPAVALAGCIAGACEPEYSWDTDPRFGGMTSLTSAVAIVDGQFTNEGECTIEAAQVTVSLVDTSREPLTSDDTTIRDLPGGETASFTVHLEIEQWMADTGAADPWEVDVEFVEG